MKNKDNKTSKDVKTSSEDILFNCSSPRIRHENLAVRMPLKNKN